ncbi:MAG: nucleoside kinase [Anaerovoracaceae bacterium]
MEINIRLIVGPREKEIQRTVKKGSTLESLVNEYPHLPYKILAAKVDNKVTELTKTIEEPCTIEFLDMRDNSANLIYQRSISLIYLKAVCDVLGINSVGIENSLNKGLYTEIKQDAPLTEKNVKDIEKRMRQIVDMDLPFIKEIVPKEEALEVLVMNGHTEKTNMLMRAIDVTHVPFYSIDGFKNFFYGQMVPSTSYIQYFELLKYRKGVLLRFPHPSNPDKLPEFVDEIQLYKAFGEATRWGDIMDIHFVGDLNKKIEDGEYKEIIQISEALHEKKIAEIADLITKSKKRIVLIAGPSSSGKTTFARRLIIQLKVNGKHPLYLGTDDYFHEREDTPLDQYGERNYEDLEAIDVKLFNKDMNGLLNGEQVDIPRFDFINGTKIFGERIISAKEGEPIIIEGIHGLNSKLTADIDESEKFKIYISPLTQLSIDDHNRIPTTDNRLLRRMVRDYKFRGNNAQYTIKNWPKVRAGEDKNIFPFNSEADVFFNSVHIYELSVLRKYAEPLLKVITREEPEYGEAVRLLKFLAFFEIIEDDSVIVNNSILREFIGGSVWGKKM